MEQSSSAILSLLKYCTFSHKKRTIVFLGPGLVPFHFQHKTATLLCPFDFCIPLVADYPTNSVLYFFFFVWRLLKQERRCSIVQQLESLCFFHTKVLQYSLTLSWCTGKWITFKKQKIMAYAGFAQVHLSSTANFKSIHNTIKSYICQIEGYNTFVTQWIHS